uniref:Uncharacterized protein n=1 Tax=Anguilla anguilla TaxID=7936 RepID=A0A0E9VCI2_ANGAN
MGKKYIEFSLIKDSVQCVECISCVSL